MKTVTRLAIGTVLLCGLLVGVSAKRNQASDQSLFSAKKIAPAADGSQSEVSLLQKKAKKKRRKARGRLPSNYAKVGISKSQRTKIYSIQSMYRDKLAELAKQIRDMRSKRDKEIHEVLTAEQKTELEKLEAATRKKREDRKKKRSKKSKT
ncbi:MAG: hypothetical protein IID59_07115 [Proteobacteria bacterium]|nr:hypothetical protein [Pseudomonadota bacterium]